jgi:hypothetical protein
MAKTKILNLRTMKKEKHKKRLQKCQETHQQPDIEIDARLLEDQEEH